MRREEVLHVARAAARIAGVTNVVIVGSQAVLGTYSEDELPPAALASVEADVLVLHDLDGTAAQSISGAIGQMSMFHREYDYYADGVELSELTFPDGWQGRLLSPGGAVPASGPMPRVADPVQVRPDGRRGRCRDSRATVAAADNRHARPARSRRGEDGHRSEGRRSARPQTRRWSRHVSRNCEPCSPRVPVLETGGPTAVTWMRASSRTVRRVTVMP